MATHGRSKLYQVDLADLESEINRGIFVDNPEFQRGIDTKRVDEIVKSLEADLKNYHNIEGLGVLIIGNINGKKYMIDGQHRFASYCKLQAPQKIDVQEWTCASMDEVRDLFKRFNLLVPVDRYIQDAKTQDQKQAGDALVAYVRKEYKNFLSNSANPHFPNINIQVFRKVMPLLPGYENLTVADVPAFFDSFNKRCGAELLSSKDKNDQARHAKAIGNIKQLFINRKLLDLLVEVG